jgi:hypothetical protein
MHFSILFGFPLEAWKTNKEKLKNYFYFFLALHLIADSSVGDALSTIESAWEKRRGRVCLNQVDSIIFQQINNGKKKRKKYNKARHMTDLLLWSLGPTLFYLFLSFFLFDFCTPKKILPWYLNIIINLYLSFNK